MFEGSETLVFLVLGDFVILDFDESGAFKLFTKALASIQLVSKTSMGLLTWTDCKIAVAPIDEHENLALVHYYVPKQGSCFFHTSDSHLFLNQG